MKAFLLTFALVFCAALPASAHVSVDSPGAEPGGYAVLTFRVPTESDTASTTAFAVSMPKFSSVSVLAMTGWTYAVKKSGSTVTEIDWTASSGASAVKPGEFAQFAVSAGPLPKTGSVSFGAVQTYSDGTVVRWNQTAAPGTDVEPDHPKPTLDLTAAVVPAAAKPASTTAPTVLSIVAVVLAAAALGVAVVGNARRSAAVKVPA